MKPCAICKSPSVDDRDVLCATHDDAWRASPEADRFRRGHRYETMFADFIRRLQAERLNGRVQMRHLLAMVYGIGVLCFCDPRIYVLLTILGERVGLREWDPGKPIPSLATDLFEKHRFVVDIPELDLRWPVAVWRRK